MTELPPVCFLPGRWNNGRAWAYDDPDRDPISWFLSRSYEVSLGLYRATALQDDLDALARITLDDLLTDVRAALGRLAGAERPVVLIGYSVGAALATLVVTQKPPVTIGGIVLLDGGLHPDVPDPAPSDGPVVRSVSSHPRFAHLSERHLAGRLAATTDPPPPWGLPRDRDQLRYLLQANDPWWPTGVLAELAAAAADPLRRRRWAEPGGPPVLGVVCPASGASGERCRRTVASSGASVKSIIELPATWNHVDVVSHPLVATVWQRVADWISRSVGGIDERT